MATIDKKLIHFNRKADFEARLAAGEIRDYSIVCIKDAKLIWTHGQYYGDLSECLTKYPQEFTKEEKGQMLENLGYYFFESDGNLEAFELSEEEYGKILSARSVILDIMGVTIFPGSGVRGASYTYPFIDATARLCGTYTLDITSNPLKLSLEQIALPSKTSDLENDSNFVSKTELSNVAMSGSYDDLTNKPTIPSAVTESTVSGWGFTKNTGTYSKPSTGIPKNDLASAVQTSLDKADTALQAHQDISGKQDKLVSGTNIKTLNETSILGSGNIVIEGGNVNLLRNSGFTGDFRVEQLASDTELGLKTEVYSYPLKYWSGSAEVMEDSHAVSGRSVVIGNIIQEVSLSEDSCYVFSFEGKGVSVTVSCGTYSNVVPLSEEYERKELRFLFSGDGVLSISGEATLCNIQLERGTLASDWKPSVLDNDKALDEFQKIKYLTDGIKEISSEELKGLVFTGMVKLGNYKDGSFQKENGGLSGVYNDDTDVLMWSGGTYEQAIQTMNAFRENHHLNPTPAEWETMVPFVFPHSGSGLFRGHVFATGGDLSVSRVDSKSYYSNGLAGVTQAVNIPGIGGVYEMTYSNGILVSSNFIPEQ